MTTPALHLRDFPTDELHVRKGDDGEHYAEGLAVPFNTPADIIEIRSGAPIAYREQFAPGAFARALRAPNRVTLVYGHSIGFGDRLGHVVELAEDGVGLRMVAKLDRSRADQAIDALTSSHGALSIAFASIVPKHGAELPNSLVTRRSVHLDHIGAVSQGAYDGARLTSVREGQPDPDPTEAEKAARELEERQRELREWVDRELAENPWANLR